MYAPKPSRPRKVVMRAGSDWGVLEWGCFLDGEGFLWSMRSVTGAEVSGRS